MILINGLSKSFNDKSVLNNISIEIPEGSKVGVLGPSGIGKTTLLNILMGLIKPDSGSITGCNIGAAVFQEDRLFDSLSAFENVAIACGQATKEEIIADLKFLLPDTDLENTPVSKFSGGMRRRVAVVRACLADSDMVVMDEPFAGLDDQTSVICADYIMRKCQNKTLFMATHKQGLINFDLTIEP